jgi:hypothetical protein
MKKPLFRSIRLAHAMLVTAGTLQATPISIRFGGTVTGFDARGVVNGIAVNDAFQVIVTYDDAAFDTISTSDGGRYLCGVNPAMIVTSGGNQLTISGPMREWIGNGVQDSFTAEWQGADATFVTPWTDGHMWGRASLTLRDLLGAALDSDALPTNINLADWNGEKSFLVYGGNGYGQFEMRGEITSANRVPETLPGGFVAAGLIGLLGVARFRAQMAAQQKARAIHAGGAVQLRLS